VLIVCLRHIGVHAWPTGRTFIRASAARSGQLHDGPPARTPGSADVLTSNKQAAVELAAEEDEDDEVRDEGQAAPW
jgi:hypothetical protein